MKKIIICLLCSFNLLTLNGQKLTVIDLTNLCNKNKFDYNYQSTILKNWDYYDSKKGDLFNSNVITWSYEKEYYGDKAAAWLRVFVYDEVPSKLLYSVFNKESYTYIQNTISSAGFRQIKSEIEDNEVITTYSNLSFILKVSTVKAFNNNGSFTTYNITLTRKEGVYDEDNGKKTTYYDDGNIEAEYTLLNGNLNGLFTSYYNNGNKKNIRVFLNGEKNGLNIEYNENGSINNEFTYAKGVINGPFKIYEDGVLIKSGNYLDGKEHGNFVEYYENGSKESEYSMSNGDMNGPHKMYYNNGKLKRLGYYKDGFTNGDFTEFRENGNKLVEYSMINGIQNNNLKLYHENGLLKRIGFFVDGKENGFFVDYDENGIIETECEYKNGKRDGLLKKYENGKISFLRSLKGDTLNGQAVDYVYDDKTGDLQLKLVYEYNGEKLNGTSSLYYLDKDKENLLSFTNYTNGIKNGPFKSISGDSVIVGTYKNDLLHGNYKLFYKDILLKVLGLPFTNTDTTKLTLLEDGNYFEGIEHGYWKYFNITETLIAEGNYIMGKKNNEWKYYYTNWAEENNIPHPYSKKLYLISNYSNDQLDGKSIRYSYQNDEKFPCKIEKNNSIVDDTCSRYVFEKVFEITHYKNGSLNGLYELRDSLNLLVSKGNFKDDLRDGEWIHRLSYNDNKNNTVYYYKKGNYVKDTPQGMWVEYEKEGVITEKYNYLNGELNGEYLVWNQNGVLRKKMMFEKGKLKHLTLFDNSGSKAISTLELFEDQLKSTMCKHTLFRDSLTISQDYWLKKDEDFDYVIFDVILVVSLNDKNYGTKGYKDGEYKVLNINNQPEIAGKYFKEDMIGTWSFYYYDQGLKIEYIYEKNIVKNEKYLTLNGELYSGKFEFNDEKNGLKEKRKIKNGLRNGKTIYIDLNTNKIYKKENYKNGELKLDE